MGDEVEGNAVEVHVSRLREKVGHEVVQVVRGVDYRLGRGRTALSLKRRLGLGVAAAVALSWRVAAACANLVIRQESDKASGSAPQETAQRLLPLAVVEIRERESSAGPPRFAGVAPHAEVLVDQVRNSGGRILLQSHDADPAVFPACPRRAARSTTACRVGGAPLFGAQVLRAFNYCLESH